MSTLREGKKEISGIERWLLVLEGKKKKSLSEE